MSIRIVDTGAGFDELEGAWNHLTEEKPDAFFSTYDYVRTAWKHFHRSTDRLFLLVFQDGASIRGIAPFYMRSRRIRGIPVRCVRFISTWEGDRPRIVVSGSGEAAWREIFSFLEKEFRDWEILELPEQPIDGPDGNGWSFLPASGWHWESSPGGVDHYVSLEGTWDEYLAGLDSGSRCDWRRRSRRLSSSPGGCVVERISDPARILDALSRFVALERSGWKAEAGIGVAKDEAHRAFYEDLLPRLAAKGQAVVCFLKSGGEDMAGVINFIRKDVIFGRHTAYSPSHAAHSPGVLLRVECIRDAFGKAFREFDFLTMKGDGASNAKSDWANRRRETVDWTGYRASGRLLPLVAAKRLKRLLGHESGRRGEER